MTNLTTPYHEALQLQNFTTFSDQTFDFVPGINVLVGENGTGKTHVLKALYSWQLARHLSDPGRAAKYDSVFTGTYGVKSVRELQRSKGRIAVVSGKYGDSAWSVGLQNDTATDNGCRTAPLRPVFIPSIEMMAHARNMNGIMRDYADFDRTCFDFLAMVTAGVTTHRSNEADVGSEISNLKVLKDLVPGVVESDESEQRFYLSEHGKRLPYSLVAEGIRKVTALYRLVELNWLMVGGVLFWDEPEVNINPRWMDEIIEALMILAAAGIQIFLATHSYIMLKQIELTLRLRRNLKEKDVQARFFSLRKERGVSMAMSADNFSDLLPNSILDQYDQMLAQDWYLAGEEERAI